MQHLITCFETRIQESIEIQCNLNDAPCSVHAIRMNDARMQSISMLIEICPKTNHQKLVNKREKDVGVEDIHTHTHTYYNICPLDEGSE